MKTLWTLLLLSASMFAQVAQVAHGGTGQNVAGNNYVLIGTSSYVYMLVSLPDCQDTGGNHWNYNATTHVVTCGNTSAAISCGTMPALTGDVTSTAGTCTTVLTNIPTGTTQAGTIVGTNVSAPASPASGHDTDYHDSTDLRFHDKNASGVIGTTVVAHTAATHKFFNGVSVAGAFAEAQPDYSDLTGTPGACATCLLGSSLGAGYVHAPGSSQTMTSVTLPRAIPFSIYNPGGLTSGTTEASFDIVTVPFGCTISAYDLSLSPSGTITVKFWKKATGTAIPTSSDSISTSGVGISTGTAIHSTTVSDFTTTTVTKDDVMVMDITAVTGTPNLVNGVLQCDQSQ